MRYINSRFTYLLTYLLIYISLQTANSAHTKIYAADVADRPSSTLGISAADFAISGHVWRRHFTRRKLSLILQPVYIYSASVALSSYYYCYYYGTLHSLTGKSLYCSATVSRRHRTLRRARLVPNSTTRISATDMYNTTNGHRQRTSSQQFYNLLYNKFTTNGQKFATSQHLDMSRCWALALRCGKFVVQQVAVFIVMSLSVGGVLWRCCTCP